ncbi:MAG: hypothetical protein U0Q12_24955 [Vicinamibacterales bacterium]
MSSDEVKQLLGDSNRHELVTPQPEPWLDELWHYWVPDGSLPYLRTLTVGLLDGRVISLDVREANVDERITLYALKADRSGNIPGGLVFEDERFDQLICKQK